MDRGPSPAFALSLVQRLPDDSMTAALASGGRQYFGWGMDRHLKASLYDALNMNTRATGNWAKGKVPTFPGWPRPKADGGTRHGDQGKKPVTVADIYARFARR